MTGQELIDFIRENKLENYEILVEDYGYDLSKVKIYRNEEEYNG